MDLSRAAYEAYCTSLGGQVPDTDAALVPWEEMPEQSRGAWRAVAHAVGEAIGREMETGSPEVELPIEEPPRVA